MIYKKFISSLVLSLHLLFLIGNSIGSNLPSDEIVQTALNNNTVPLQTNFKNVSAVSSNNQPSDATKSTNEQTTEFMDMTTKPYLSSSNLTKQIPAIATDPLGFLSSPSSPCACDDGVCKCCTGFLFSAFKSKGCAMVRYIPEEFGFEFKMLINENVLYKNKLMGRNPPPVCVNPRRFPLVEVCVDFYDIYFVGRNLHMCMEMNANFNGLELINRDFECMHVGTNGVGLNSPGDNIGLPTVSYGGGVDADVDQGDSVEEYDENVRSL